MAELHETEKAKAPTTPDRKSATTRLRTQKAKQRAFISAYKAKLFNVTEACKATGIARRTFYYWKNQAEGADEFREMLWEAQEEKKDFIETKLLEHVERGNIIATIFLAKCLLKDRGYIEQPNVLITEKPGLNKERCDAITKAFEASIRMSIEHSIKLAESVNTSQGELPETEDDWAEKDGFAD